MAKKIIIYVNFFSIYLFIKSSGIVYPSLDHHHQWAELQLNSKEIILPLALLPLNSNGLIINHLIINHLIIQLSLSLWKEAV